MERENFNHQVNFRLSPAMLSLLEQVAVYAGETRGGYIRRILIERLRLDADRYGLAATGYDTETKAAAAAAFEYTEE